MKVYKVKIKDVDKKIEEQLLSHGIIDGETIELSMIKNKKAYIISNGEEMVIPLDVFERINPSVVPACVDAPSPN